MIEEGKTKSNRKEYRPNCERPVFPPPSSHTKNPNIIKSSIDIKIVKCNENAIIPQYKTSGAAACDLCSCENITIKPLERVIVKTGLKIEIPEGYYGQISLRSGTSVNTSLLQPNSPGIVDSDYRGELGLILFNINLNDSFEIKAGDRLAQILFHKVIQGNFIEVNELSETTRGEGGFGSTGKN